MEIVFYHYDNKTKQIIKNRLTKFFTEKNIRFVEEKCRARNMLFALNDEGFIVKYKEEKFDNIFLNELCQNVFLGLNICTKQGDLFKYYMAYPELYLQLTLPEGI